MLAFAVSASVIVHTNVRTNQVPDVTASSLDLSPVDADRPAPLYHQVETDLRRLIRAGELPPGATVPPETTLAGRYDVSRHTVRKALGRLAGDDLIDRSAGRGTFVKPLPERAPFYLDRSFTRQMADMGREARSDVLEKTPDRIAADAPEPLAAHSGAPCLRLTRLRLGSGEPVGLQHATVLTEHCPELETHDFARRSLYGVLAAEYGLAIAEIRHTVSATTATKEQARRLNVAPGNPLLVVHTTALLDADRLIEHTTSFYRADRYEYRTAHVF